MTQQLSQRDAIIDLTADDEEEELIVLWENQVDQVEAAQSAQEDDIKVIYDKKEDVSAVIDDKKENMKCDGNDYCEIIEDPPQKRESTSLNSTRSVPTPVPALQVPPHLAPAQLPRGYSPVEMEVDDPEPGGQGVPDPELQTISSELLDVSHVVPGPPPSSPESSGSSATSSLIQEQMPEEPSTPTEKAPSPVMLMEQDSTPRQQPSSEATPGGLFRAPLPVTASIKKAGSSKKKNTENIPEIRSKRICVRFNETAEEKDIPSTSTAPSIKTPKFFAPDPTVWRQDRKRSFSIRTFARRPSPTPTGEEVPKEEDVPESNYISLVKFYVSRDPTIPIGLTHVPFHVELPQKQYPLVFSQLKIEKNEKLPKSVEKGIQYSRKGEPDDSGFIGYPDDSGNCPRGLAKLEKYLGPKPDQKYMKEKDREEMMWSADDLTEFVGRNSRRIKEDEFYKDAKDKYMFVIWRQFEGHIPPEFALQNLMKCRYKIPKALDTIDQYLKVLPQKLKDPSVAQVQVLQRELKTRGDWFDLRKIQDDSMRNFHIGEIFNYHIKLQRFFGVDNDRRESGGGLNGEVACNCMEPMCRQLDFEPRFGCSNCTKSLRKNPLTADKLCLICRTYTEITGNTRPAKKTVFDDEDMEKISLWDQKCKKMDRREFEKWIQNGKNKRYEALELTQEEALMLNFERINLKDKKNSIGDQVKSMLQPYKLPHFSHCQCQYSGSIPVGTPNFGKTKFSVEEEQRFVPSISKTPGNIKAAAAELKVEEELVEVFLRTYKVGNDVWKGLRRSAKIHVYPPREILPPINPPPVIPKIGTVQK